MTYLSRMDVASTMLKVRSAAVVQHQDDERRYLSVAQGVLGW